LRHLDVRLVALNALALKRLRLPRVETSAEQHDR
jgi:hypothetical protein